jgi:ADP-ribosylglycohydrolase
MDRFVDHIFACLLGGLIGDAMGTPAERLDPEEVERRYGWIEDFEGDGTDDSAMKYLLADALIRTDGAADADGWAAEWTRQRDALFSDKVGRFFQSVLHTAEKLKRGYPPCEAALGNMPSSSSAMCISPVGIVNAGQPSAAAAQAREIAGLIHINDVAFCQDGAAANAAACAAALEPGATVDAVIAAAVSAIRPWSARDLAARVEEALAIASDAADYRSFRSRYQAQFSQPIICDSRETVPATIAIVKLAGGDPVKAVTYGANFGRDADTIASMAGAICGALSGTAAFPAPWIAKATRNCARDQQALAAELAGVARRKAARESAAWRHAEGTSSAG